MNRVVQTEAAVATAVAPMVVGDEGAANPVGQREEGAKVVGWMVTEERTAATEDRVASREVGAATLGRVVKPVAAVQEVVTEEARVAQAGRMEVAALMAEALTADMKGVPGAMEVGMVVARAGEEVGVAVAEVATAVVTVAGRVAAVLTVVEAGVVAMVGTKEVATMAGALVATVGRVVTEVERAGTVVEMTVMAR